MTNIEQDYEEQQEVETDAEEDGTTPMDVVDAIFNDNRLDTLQAVSDVLQAKAFDAVQQKKLEFAQQWGFNLDDTAQPVADELADELPDNTDIPSEEQPEEEQTDETDS